MDVDGQRLLQGYCIMQPEIITFELALSEWVIRDLVCAHQLALEHLSASEFSAYVVAWSERRLVLPQCPGVRLLSRSHHLPGKSPLRDLH